MPIQFNFWTILQNFVVKTVGLVVDIVEQRPGNFGVDAAHVLVAGHSEIAILAPIWSPAGKLNKKLKDFLRLFQPSKLTCS